LQDLNPGYCGSRVNDCGQEWCTNPVAAPLVNGLPGTRIECTDDDPACDFGPAGDESCTFHVGLCFNPAEQRFACNWGGAIEEVKMNRPSPRTNPLKHPTDYINRLSLENALINIGGVASGICANPGPQHGQFCTSSTACDSSPGNGNGRCAGRVIAFTPPITTPNVCTAYADIIVPLKHTSKGVTKKRIRLRIKAIPPKPPTGRRPKADGDLIDLVCNPKP